MGATARETVCCPGAKEMEEGREAKSRPGVAEPSTAKATVSGSLVATDLEKEKTRLVLPSSATCSTSAVRLTTGSAWLLLTVPEIR